MDIIIEAILLGLGLAMDACALSTSNGLNEPKMKVKKILFISFMFGLFQGLMPLIGYILGHAFINYIAKFIPYIALILLLFLGLKMIIESIKKKDEEEKKELLTLKVIFIQAIATSLDALSVGITISNYSYLEAILISSIIAIITFIICIIAHFIGKKFGDIFSNKAEIIGGIILIIIGFEIFIKGVFF